MKIEYAAAPAVGGVQTLMAVNGDEITAPAPSTQRLLLVGGAVGGVLAVLLGKKLLKGAIVGGVVYYLWKQRR
jgi:hypothetical protein